VDAGRAVALKLDGRLPMAPRAGLEPATRRLTAADTGVAA